jgi:general secretion pathway protein E
MDAWPEFVERIPHAFAREHLVLGVLAEASPRLLHAAAAPAWILHNIGVALRVAAPLEHEPADPAEVAERIDRAYADAGRSGPAAGRTGPDAEASLDRSLILHDADLLASAGKSDTARFLDAVLFDAIRRGASDVHIHPLAEETMVRFRIDGVLVEARRLPRRMADPVVSRLKVLGSMDTAETRAPQDGRATVTLGQRGGGGGGAGVEEDDHARAVDLRISTIPTAEGERAVVRILDTDRGRRLADLDAIGMPPDVRAAYDRVAARPNGMVLLTGPTGSGKTTTLYATLRLIAAQANEQGRIGGASLNIMTVEDPVEFRLSGAGVTISQSQVNRKKGMSFASGLRHILRQDPDVVMVGEIRDAETAALAIQAALTGHLVFSTLHTNDAVGAPPRLIDLGVEPYLVSAALTAVMAQRLVRTVHGNCAGNGCAACLHTGYSGRTGIFELFALDEAARELVSQAGSATALRRHAESRGMRTLRADGLRLVRLGVTTRTEVERVTVDLGELSEPPGLEPSGVTGAADGSEAAE